MLHKSNHMLQFVPISEDTNMHVAPNLSTSQILFGFGFAKSPQLMPHLAYK